MGHGLSDGKDLLGRDGERTDLVFQSKKIARRRNTNVIAMAEMADGTRGTRKKLVSIANPATPSTEAMT